MPHEIDKYLSRIEGITDLIEGDGFAEQFVKDIPYLIELALDPKLTKADHKKKVISVNAVYSLTTRGTKIYTLIFDSEENDKEAKDILEYFFNKLEKYDSLSTYHMSLLLTHICLQKPETINFFLSKRENTIHVIDIIFRNIQYYGILEIFKILTDTSSILSSSPPDIFNQIISYLNITKYDYDHYANLVMIMRIIITRSTWNGESFRSPILRFTEHMFQHEQMTTLVNILPRYNNSSPTIDHTSPLSFNQVVVLDIMSKIFEQSEQEQLSNEGHFFNIPFIPRFEKEKYDLTSTFRLEAKEIFTRVLVEYLIYFLCRIQKCMNEVKNLVAHPKKMHIQKEVEIFPYIFKSLHSLFLNIILRYPYEYSQFAPCYRLFACLHPISIVLHYPSLASYVYDILIHAIVNSPVLPSSTMQPSIDILFRLILPYEFIQYDRMNSPPYLDIRLEFCYILSEKLNIGEKFIDVLRGKYKSDDVLGTLSNIASSEGSNFEKFIDQFKKYVNRRRLRR